ncbi:MAG: ribulose-phosphate 3-epimerase [Spirochaetales bacterium]|nr:ribulose-phosphate 3-epimerase [Spirochaetales bacterium]
MSKNEMIIAPSVLAADFCNMEKAVRLIESTTCEWIHLDVMDGKFVPAITFGHLMVKSIRGLTNLVLDVHLMVERPENQIDFFAEAGADYITIHFESSIHLHRHIQHIKELGIKAGISIIPSTPVDAIKELLPLVDQVLVMLVNPGFGGQEMIPECVDKIAKLANLRKEYGYKYLISADGGINRKTASLVRAAGLDAAVSGSSFFGAEDPCKEVLILKGRI